MTSVALRARLSTATSVSNLNGSWQSLNKCQGKDHVGLERPAWSILGLDGFDSWFINSEYSENEWGSRGPENTKRYRLPPLLQK